MFEILESIQLFAWQDTLSAAASESDLFAARTQMAFTLGFHIILACFGVGLPVLMLIAEGKSLKGDPVWRELARRWSRAFAVLFAVGAVSGTVLSFELGILWPAFMGKWGTVIGLPFTLEAFAFFVEAIFAGIYLYGWDRLSPKVHWLTAFPIAISGFMSAWFVVTANAWMNSPAGFTLDRNGELMSVDPIAAMLNAATWAQTIHMIIAAYMVSGFSVASFYAWRRWRGDKSSYVKRAMSLGLVLGCLMTPLQMASGDYCAKVVAKTQPAKFAAMEATFETQKRAPLHIGGIPDESSGEVRYSIELPGFLSFLAHGDFDAEIQGLHDFLPEHRPPVTVVHVAFQIMVGIGFYLLLLAVWSGIRLLRKTEGYSRLYLGAIILSGPLTVLAMEAGWVVTEVGRQPWIVYGYMYTRQAVSGATGLWSVFVMTLAIYGLLLAGLLVALRYLARLPREHHG